MPKGHPVWVVLYTVDGYEVGHYSSLPNTIRIRRLCGYHRDSAGWDACSASSPCGKPYRRVFATLDIAIRHARGEFV
jgi:hypothetical protein